MSTAWNGSWYTDSHHLNVTSQENPFSSPVLLNRKPLVSDLCEFAMVLYTEIRQFKPIYMIKIWTKTAVDEAKAVIPAVLASLRISLNYVNLVFIVHLCQASVLHLRTNLRGGRRQMRRQRRFYKYMREEYRYSALEVLRDKNMQNIAIPSAHRSEFTSRVARDAKNKVRKKLAIVLM